MKRSPIRKVNPERRAKLSAKSFGPKAHWIRSLPCAVCEYLPSRLVENHAAHAKSRGAGGTSADLIPLCPRCHDLQHFHGIQTMTERWGVDLQELADEYEARWQRHLNDLKD